MQSKTIALVGKLQVEGGNRAVKDVARFLAQAGHRVVLESQSAVSGEPSEYPVWTAAQIGAGAELVVVLGGDGTMLGIARQLAPYNVPLVGINQGRLGFMTDIPFKDMQRALGEILAGDYETEERSLLSGRITRAGKTILEALALNDVVVARGAVSGMVELSVEVDGRFMYSQRSDGLIVATPTGSTAYALSASGPILHSCLAGILLVPIAPHSLSNRPIVLPDSSLIEVVVTGGREVSANFDMQSYTALAHGDRISVQRAPVSIRFLHPPGYSYFATLRQKLHWNLHPAGVDEKPAPGA
jgi:NAD+ kinase